jgi:hypothetical protein
MGENPVDQVTEELEGVTDDQIVSWVREHYTQIADACDKNGIPRPPNW